MAGRIKSIVYKTAKKFMKPIVDEHLVTLSRLDQIQLYLKYQEEGRVKPLDFMEVGFNVYSATFEDGILLYIFSLIGMTNRKCVDVGAGSINGSNTANLIVNHGFYGLLIDGDPRNTQTTRDYYRKHPETKIFPPLAVSSMVTVENINTTLRDNNFTGEIDLFSLDIDGVDYWIWKALDVINPRVIVVEYQDILGPHKSWTVPYKPDFNLQDYKVNEETNNYCGASLKAFVNLGIAKGYRLVGCNKGGWNAFFVRNDIEEKLLPEVTVESCFKYEWNQYGMQRRYPMVKDMEWHEI